MHIVDRHLGPVFLVLSLALFLGCPSNETPPAGGPSGVAADNGDSQPDDDSDGADASDQAGTSGSDTAAGGDDSDAGTGEVTVAEGWGHLTGRFTLSGAPEPEKITVSQDAEYCGKFELVDETYIVGDDGGLKNVVIFIYPDRDTGPPQPHESYAEAAEQKLVLDNENCRFEPPLLLVRTSQPVEILNSDTVGHNTKVDYAPDPINPTLPPGQTLEHSFSKEQRLPVPVSCSIHPWMRAKLVVRESPYMALTDENGNFKIEYLPAGKWTFQFWHDGLGYIRNVEMDGKETEWERGRHDIAINGGNETTDLGTISLKMEDYQ